MKVSRKYFNRPQKMSEHWNSESWLPKLLRKRKISSSDKEMCTELLCNIGSLLWKRMPENILKDEEGTWVNGNMDLQKYAENIMD